MREYKNMQCTGNSVISNFSRQRKILFNITQLLCMTRIRINHGDEEALSLL